MSSKRKRKDEFGSFYTPQALADAIVDKFVGEAHGSKVAVEPGAGTGPLSWPWGGWGGT